MLSLNSRSCPFDASTCRSESIELEIDPGGVDRACCAAAHCVFSVGCKKLSILCSMKLGYFERRYCLLTFTPFSFVFKSLTMYKLCTLRDSDLESIWT